MAGSPAKQRILRQAADLIGRDELATRLGISKSLLDAWIRGDVTMPDGQLLKLSVILEKVAKHKK